tara:strand:+ start:624 stop:1052 length:429 start_codon:yes stop_codon:yes gene_type:complete
MKNEFDAIDDALEVSAEIINEPVKKPTRTSIKRPKGDSPEIQKDYEYSRAQLYSLVEKGQEALDGILEVAQESESARAYEVAGQVLKSTADIADKLMDLQKKVKDIEEVDTKQPQQVTNNSLFVGSTAELQKMLKQTMKDSK